MTYYSLQIAEIMEKYLPDPRAIDCIITSKHYIDTHLCNPININEISASSYLSKFHFIRLFKRCYGRTPYKYLTEARIEMAKHFLKSGLAVGETCLRVGFESPASFSLLFKKQTGISPSAYSKRAIFDKSIPT